MTEQSRPPTFEAVYADYGDRIYRYCYRLCNGDAAAAEDVAQETWLRALRGLAQLQRQEALEGWLYTIARREWLRTRRSPLKTTVMSNLPGTDEIADERAAPQIDHLAIQLCLARLAQSQREALILVKMEGLTHQEAAAILQRPQGTVQSQVAEALKRLRRMLVEERHLLSVPPLALLERELRGWGDVPAPPALRARIESARAGMGGAQPLPLPPGGDPSAPPVPDVAALPPGLASWMSARWLAAAALLLPALVIPFSRRRAPVPPPIPADPERVLAAAAGIRSLHAVGLREQFNLTRWGYKQNGNWKLDYWYQSPDRVRLESRDTLLPLTSIQVTEGGRLRLRQVDRLAKTVQTFRDARTQNNVPSVLGFVDGGSQLARLLRTQRGGIPVQPVQVGGRALRQLRVADAFGDTVRRWQLTVDPATGRVVQLRMESTVSGSLGVYVQGRETLSEITYDVPVPEGIFTLPNELPAR